MGQNSQYLFVGQTPDLAAKHQILQFLLRGEKVDIPGQGHLSGLRHRKPGDSSAPIGAAVGNEGRGVGDAVFRRNEFQIRQRGLEPFDQRDPVVAGVAAAAVAHTDLRLFGHDIKHLPYAEFSIILTCRMFIVQTFPHGSV